MLLSIFKAIKGGERKKLCSVTSVNIYTRHFYDKNFYIRTAVRMLSFGCTFALLN